MQRFRLRWLLGLQRSRRRRLRRRQRRYKGFRQIGVEQADLSYRLGRWRIGAFVPIVGERRYTLEGLVDWGRKGGVGYEYPDHGTP
jgi:hypothetical protein